MGPQTGRAVLDPARVPEIPAAGVQEIQRTVAEQAVECVWIRTLMAGKIFAVAVAEKTAVVGHRRLLASGRFPGSRHGDCNTPGASSTTSQPGNTAMAIQTSSTAAQEFAKKAASIAPGTARTRSDPGTFATMLRRGFGINGEVTKAGKGTSLDPGLISGLEMLAGGQNTEQDAALAMLGYQTTAKGLTGGWGRTGPVPGQCPGHLVPAGHGAGRIRQRCRQGRGGPDGRRRGQCHAPQRGQVRGAHGRQQGRPPSRRPWAPAGHGQHAAEGRFHPPRGRTAPGGGRGRKSAGGKLPPPDAARPRPEGQCQGVCCRPPWKAGPGP